MLCSQSKARSSGERRGVAVIGAGMSSLVAAKCLLEEGLEPVVYEQVSQIGGLWNYHETPIAEEGRRAMWMNNQPEWSARSVCSFCGKRQDQVDRLTAGPGDVSICNECVALYREHIEQLAGERITMGKFMQVCRSCGTRSPASHRYCYQCGAHLTQDM